MQYCNFYKGLLEKDSKNELACSTKIHRTAAGQYGVLCSGAIWKQE